MPGSVITRKGQVTIPKAIRDEIQLRIGDRVSFVVRNGEVVLRRPPKSILDLQGSVKPSRQPELRPHPPVGQVSARAESGSG